MTTSNLDFRFSCQSATSAWSWHEKVKFQLPPSLYQQSMLIRVSEKCLIGSEFFIYSWLCSFFFLFFFLPTTKIAQKKSLANENSPHNEKELRWTKESLLFAKPILESIARDAANTTRLGSTKSASFKAGQNFLWIAFIVSILRYTAAWLQNSFFPYSTTEALLKIIASQTVIRTT